MQGGKRQHFKRIHKGNVEQCAKEENLQTKSKWKNPNEIWWNIIKKWLQSNGQRNLFYPLLSVFRRQGKARKGSKEATRRQEVEDAIKSLFISSYMFTLQRVSEILTLTEESKSPRLCKDDFQYISETWVTSRPWGKKQKSSWQHMETANSPSDGNIIQFPRGKQQVLKLELTSAKGLCYKREPRAQYCIQKKSDRWWNLKKRRGNTTRTTGWCYSGWGVDWGSGFGRVRGWVAWRG